MRLRTASRLALSALAAAFLAAAPLAWGQSPHARGAETTEGTAGSLVATSPLPPETRAPELSPRPHTEVSEPDLKQGQTTSASSALPPASEPEAEESAEAPSSVAEAEVESLERDSAAEARPADQKDTTGQVVPTPAGPGARTLRPRRPDTYDSWSGLL